MGNGGGGVRNIKTNICTIEQEENLTYFLASTFLVEPSSKCMLGSKNHMTGISNRSPMFLCYMLLFSIRWP